MDIVVENKKFEVVDRVPQGYEIWNVDLLNEKGYLPLCQCDNYKVNTGTLKCIKCNNVEEIVYCTGVGQKTIKQMKTYIKRYSKSKNVLTSKRVSAMKIALKSLSELEFE